MKSLAIIEKHVKMTTDSCIIVCTPNDKFKNLFKKEALQNKITLNTLDNVMTKQILKEHSVVFVTPYHDTKEERDQIFDNNKNLIFQAIAGSWSPGLIEIPSNIDLTLLYNLFDIQYFPCLVDLFNVSANELGFSALIVKPNQPVLDWIQQNSRGNVDTTLSELRLHSAALLTPHFPTEASKEQFLKKHYKEIFSFALMKYSLDESVWPENSSWEDFLEWFECENYFPVLDIKTPST